MRKLATFVSLGVAAFLAAAPVPAAAASPAGLCAGRVQDGIPSRGARAPAGSAVMEKVLNLSGNARDRVLAGEVLAGNIPSFLRELSDVRFSGQLSDGNAVDVTICVTPDYLAVGDDRDYVRTPLGLPAAAEIADRLGFFLPTPRMVDAIYEQAGVRLAPSPLQPTNEMTTTRYFWQHDRIIEEQRAPHRGQRASLTAGQKKDLVLTQRLRAAPGRVAIYGWHRPNGRPIQPLSTVHGAAYADYSHGIRLVSNTAFVNGRPFPLSDLMQNPELARIVSSEGPIADPRGLQASLYR